MSGKRSQGALELALLVWLSAVSQSPAQPAHRQDPFQQALEFCRQGKLRQSLPYYDRAIATSPGKAELYYNRALAYQHLDLFARAIADYDAAIRLDPLNATAYYNRALARGQLKQHQAAIADYTQAVRLDKQYADAYLNRGNAYFELKQYEKAISDFVQVIAIEPGDAQAYFSRGRACARLGQTEEAAMDYGEAINRNPQFARAYFSRAIAYVCLQQGDSASADATHFLKLKGWADSSSAYAALLGYVAFRQVHKDKSAAWLMDEAGINLKATAWPYPIVLYLRGQLSLPGLLKAASNRDLMTEARTYAGVDLALSHKDKEALEQLNWVKDHGNKMFDEYNIAVSCLQSLSCNNHQD